MHAQAAGPLSLRRSRAARLQGERRRRRAAAQQGGDLLRLCVEEEAEGVAANACRQRKSVTLACPWRGWGACVLLSVYNRERSHRSSRAR